MQVSGNRDSSRGCQTSAVEALRADAVYLRALGDTLEGYMKAGTHPEIADDVCAVADRMDEFIAALDPHASNCPVHNAPALEPGACDCGGEWHLAGRLLYTLQHAGWRRGKEEFKNRLMVNVTGHGVPDEELDALTARLLATLNATPGAGFTEDERALLSDPKAVHLNMLRGGIAKPSVEAIIHLYGADALRAAMPATTAHVGGVGWKLEAACADLARMVEGHGALRWVAGPYRFKDRPEWVAFYNAWNAHKDAAPAQPTVSGYSREAVAEFLERGHELRGSVFSLPREEWTAIAEDVLAFKYPAAQPEAIPGREEIVERLNRVIDDLDVARLPTKPDVFTACGRDAGQLADDIRTILALLSSAKGE